MARHVELKGREFWILSEPQSGPEWRATVMEVMRGGTSEALDINATAETRTAADDAAERALRRMLRA
jgi:hypothetical protein